MPASRYVVKTHKGRQQTSRRLRRRLFSCLPAQRRHLYKKHEFLLHVSMSGSAFFHVTSWGTSHNTKTRVVGHGCCQIISQQRFALLYNLPDMLDHSRNPKRKLSCSPPALKYEIFFLFTFATMPDVTLGITKIYMNLNHSKVQVSLGFSSPTSQ